MALHLRPQLLARLERPGAWSRFTASTNTYAMPLYLFHMTAAALALLGLRWVFGYQPSTRTTVAWWLTRPLILALSVVLTVPLIWAFGRLAALQAAALRRRGRSGTHRRRGRLSASRLARNPAGEPPAAQARSVLQPGGGFRSSRSRPERSGAVWR